MASIPASAVPLVFRPRVSLVPKDFREAVDVALRSLCRVEGLPGCKCVACTKASAFLSCGSIFRVCSNESCSNYIARSCHVRGCADCAKERRKKLVDDFVRVTLGVDSSLMRAVLFTDELVSAGHIRSEVKSRLSDARKVCSSMFGGSLLVCEIKPHRCGRPNSPCRLENGKCSGVGCYHVHVHGLAVSKSSWVDYGAIISAWRKRRGGRIVYASGEMLQSRLGFIGYIVGYLAKGWSFADGSAKDLAVVIQAVDGLRLYRTAGCLFRRAVKECQNTLAIVVGGSVLIRKQVVGSSTPARRTFNSSTEKVHRTILCSRCGSEMVAPHDLSITHPFWDWVRSDGPP